MRINIKLSKLNIISIAIVACIGLIIAAAGGTIAYFTDAKDITNVYTTTGVYITLTEAAVQRDANGQVIRDATGTPVIDPANRISGKDLADTSKVINDYGYVYPGMTIHKDPTIKNVGLDSIWVAAKIIIEDRPGDIGTIYGEQNGPICLTDLLTGGAIAPFDDGQTYGTWNGIEDVTYNENYAIIQSYDATTGIREFYIYFLNPLAKDGEIVIFDKMVIDPSIDNTSIQNFANLKITVQAFGVQKFGFSDCYTAMGAAFKTHFPSTAVSS